MADNISVTQGFGTAMATDEVDGVHYPRTKIVFGAPDSPPQDVSSASRLPVDTGIDVSALATEATLASIDGKLDALATEETLASIEGKLDALATEETLASIDGKIGDFATEATLASIDGKIGDFATEATLASIDGKIGDFATEATLLSVDAKLSVGQPGVARQLAAGAASASTALTSSVRRVSIFARSANIRYAVGAGSQTASATSHYIAQGERLLIAVPASSQIAVIRADSTDGTLELTEL